MDQKDAEDSRANCHDALLVLVTDLKSTRGQNQIEQNINKLAIDHF